MRAAAKYDIALVDRQLCCAPIGNDEASRYLGAMTAAANFAFVNRQAPGRSAGMPHLPHHLRLLVEAADFFGFVELGD